MVKEIRKKMSRQKEEQEEGIDFSKTPSFDKVCHDVAKYLAAGAETFIPMACDALRQDWYPGVSDKGLRDNLRAQKRIRDRVFDSLSNDRGNRTPWGDRRILLCFPKWLKNPVQEESNAEVSQRGGDARKQLSKELKSSIVTLTEGLPESVYKREQESEEQIPELQTPDEPEGSNEPLDAATVREITIHQHDTELTAAEQAILKALKNKEHLRHLFNEIASSSDNTLAKLSINGHMEKLDKIRSLVDNALSILQDIKV